MTDGREEEPASWRKRIHWCRCDSPTRDAIEAITSLCIEGTLSPLEAKVELLTQKIDEITLNHASEEILKQPDSVAREAYRHQAAMEDLYIALTFTDELLERKLQTPAMRQRLLAYLIREQRQDEKGID